MVRKKKVATPRSAADYLISKDRAFLNLQPNYRTPIIDTSKKLAGAIGA